MRSLQCARAGAALLVVYFHAVLQILLFGPSRGEGAALTATAFPFFGKCGVDIFFVLSGLLIWRSTQRGPQTIAGFYRKRLLRIAPLYWTITLLAALATFVLPGLLHSTRLDPVHLVASLLFIPWPNPAALGGSDAITPLLIPGWTLNFEVLFYVVFGLTLAVRDRLRLLVNAALFLAIITLVIGFGDANPSIAFYDPGLLVEFLVGLALGAALDRGVLLPLPVAWLALPIAIAALCWFDAVAPGTGRFAAATLPALAILYALASIDLRDAWPDIPTIVLLGDASFSLYLSHVFVLAALRAVFARVGLSLARPGPQALFVAAGLVLSCLFAVLVYRLLERPLGALLGSGPSRRTRLQSSAA